MKRSTRTGLEVGVVIGSLIKSAVMIVATIGIIGWAVFLAYKGEWVTAAIVAFIIEPVAMFVLDLATGLVVAAFAGAGGTIGAAFGRRSDEDD